MNDSELEAMQAVAHPAVPAEIVVAEARLRAAQLAADIAELDALIADEILFTGPDGQLGTKAADLASHAAGVVRFCDHQPEELRSRSIGTNTVITALRARLAVEVEGRLIRGVYRYTRVWSREHERDWRVVGGHVSDVGAASDETSAS